MTNENRKQNIRDELARAHETLRAARILLDAKLPNDAVSRAYYAAFHAMRAAVISRGIDPKTHAGTLTLFNREITRAGLLPPFNKLLTGLSSAREAADYEAGVSFTLEEAMSMTSDAASFVNEVESLLTREGWAVAGSR